MSNKMSYSTTHSVLSCNFLIVFDLHTYCLSSYVARSRPGHIMESATRIYYTPLNVHLLISYDSSLQCFNVFL